MQGTQHTRLFGRLLERAPDFVSFGLVIVLGFLLAKLVWMIFPAEPRLPVAEVVSNSNAAGGETAARRDLGQEIAAAHLFGVYTADNNEPVVADVRPTQLNLKLQGVFAAAGQRGYAVIEEGGQQTAYAAGDALGGGVTLEQILPESVLLRRNGVLEKLELPKQALPDVTSASFIADEPPPDMENYEEPPMEMEMEMPPPEMFQPSEGAIPPPQPDRDMSPGMMEPAQTDGNSLSQFRDAVLNNNMRLLEVASPQPYERDGQFLGFQLTPGSNVAMFNQLGLQSGDVVTAINGTPLSNPATAMKVLQEVATASQVNLSVTRNGQELNLPISFQ